MNLSVLQKTSIILALIIILSGTYYTYTHFLPQYEDQFISLAILGSEKSLGNYYPYDDSTLGINIPIQWYFRLFSNKPEIHNVLIKVKVLNKTQPSPNSTLCLPSPIRTAVEFPITLEGNETLIYSFFWQISNVEYFDDNVVITELTANNLTIPLNTSSINGNNFRLIFELWVFDASVDGYTFIQKGFTDRCVWNQMWFNVVTR